MMREEFEFDVNDFVQDDDDTKGLVAQFYTQAVKDEVASLEAGRPIFKDVEFVKIHAIGNTFTVLQYEVDEYQRRRFAKQYANFKRHGEGAIVGTPLSEIPWIGKSQAEEYRYLGIRSIEDLANVSDSVCTGISGLFSLKARAIAWVEEAKGGVGNAVLAKQIEDLTRQIAGMKALEVSKENTKKSA
jgi:hypothetical protein